MQLVSFSALTAVRITDSLFQWPASVEWDVGISEEIVKQLYQPNVAV